MSLEVTLTTIILRQVSPLSCPLGKGFEAFSFIIVGPSMAIDWWLDI